MKNFLLITTTLLIVLSGCINNSSHRYKKGDIVYLKIDSTKCQVSYLLGDATYALIWRNKCDDITGGYIDDINLY